MKAFARDEARTLARAIAAPTLVALLLAGRCPGDTERTPGFF